MLLYESGFEDQRLNFVIGNDVFQICNFPDKMLGLKIKGPAFLEIRAHTLAQRSRFAHINNFSLRIFVYIYAGIDWQIIKFLLKHGINLAQTASIDSRGDADDRCCMFQVCRLQVSNLQLLDRLAQLRFH